MMMRVSVVVWVVFVMYGQDGEEEKRDDGAKSSDLYV